MGKSGGNEEKVKEKAPQAKKIAFWAPRRGAKTTKIKEKVIKIGPNQPKFSPAINTPPIRVTSINRGVFLTGIVLIVLRFPKITSR